MEVTLHRYVGQHRNIIEFYDSGEDDVWMWIAMELAEGGDLFDKVESDAGLKPEIAHAYFTQLINAVGYMHSRGIGHRDLKPENVLLDADGNLKLADFGMASLFEYNGKRKKVVTLCGSPPYVAPEVLTCGSHDKAKAVGYDADKADIWSCGVVLFVLLAGNTPWSKPVEGRDEYGRPNEYSEYIQSNGRPDDELWQVLPDDVLSLLRGMLNVNTSTSLVHAAEWPDQRPRTIQ
jgi:serine/threonine-protein kinase CHEK1